MADPIETLVDPFAEQQGGARPFETGTTGQARPSSLISDPREAARLDDAAKRAKAKTPDQAGRIFRLQAKTGLPAATIERNIDEVERQVAAPDFDADVFRQTSPMVASWLAQHPDHLALAQDDLAPLAGIERALQIGGNMTRALGAGVARMTAGMWGAAEALADVDPTGFLDADFARETRRVAEHLTNRIRGPQTGAGTTEQAVYGGLESIGQTLSLAPLAFTPAGAAGLLASLGLTTGGEAYGEARDAGKGVATSLGYGGVQGAIEVATEKIPVLWFMRDIAKHTGIGKLVMRQLAAELPGEQVATVLQDLNTWAVLNPDRPFADYQAERPEAAYQTLVSTLVAVGGQSTLVRVLDRAANGGKPTSQRAIEELGAAVTESKLRERSPEKFAELVEQATKDGLDEIGIPVDAFVTYWQEQGEDPERIAELWTGDPNALARADATGGDLAVPTSRYIAQVAPTEHNAFFAMEARLDPLGMTAREEAEFEADQDAMSLPATEAADPVVAVEESLTKMLVDENGFERTAAETYAKGLAEGLVNVAARASIDLPALLKKWMPTIRTVSRSRRQAVQRNPISARLSADVAGAETAGRAGAPDGAAERAAPDALRDATDGGARPVIAARRPDDIPTPYRAYFDEVAADARARGFAGTDDQLAGAYLAKLEAAREIALELGELESEHGSEGLLQAIADAGGINALDETGYVEEVNTLQENLGGTYERRNRRTGERGDKQYNLEAGIRGIRGAIVTRRKAKSLEQQAFAKRHGKKMPKSGLSLDLLMTHLVDERGFKFDNLADMVESIFEAVHDYQRGASSVAGDVLSALSSPGGVGVHPGADWFTDLTFEQGGLFDDGADVLDTGEAQPRLPGAEDVREQEIATPEFDAPWSLTAEVAKVKSKQETLFQRAASAVTETPAFKKWFRDSKVVDQAGKPLIVYHGTGNTRSILDTGFSYEFTEKGNDQYGSGFYFTTNDATARSYERSRRAMAPDVEKPGGESAPGTLAVYLSIQKPIRVDASRDRSVFEEMPTLTRAQVIKLIDAAPNLEDFDDGPLSNWGDVSHEGRASVRNRAIDAYVDGSPFAMANDFYPGAAQTFLKNYSKVTGYDGIEVVFPEIGETHYVAWFPEQIKSATDNAGTFDPKSPNILFQAAALTDSAVREFAKTLHDRAGLAVLEMHLTGRGDIALDFIATKSNERRKGIGTAAMEAIAQFADQHQRRVVLSPVGSRRAERAGLVAFYERFGFKENTDGAHTFLKKTDMVREPAPLDTLFQPAWHGSPHTFDKFSIDKIGTGEGAAAFGWGLYFAENPDVAREYQRRLSDASSPHRFFVKGNKTPIAENTPERHAASLVYFTDRAELKPLVKRWLTEAADDAGMIDTARLAGLSSIDYWTRISQFVDTHTKKDIRAEQGSIYKVDIADKHVAKMIDHDAPLSKQTADVQQIVREILQRNGYLREGEDGPRQLVSAWREYRGAEGGMASPDSGAAVYDAVVREFKLARNVDRGWDAVASTMNDIDGSPRAASLFLWSRGVTGIRYLDEGSRDKKRGKKTRNLVVFDDSIVKVTHRDGSPMTTEEREEFLQKERATAGPRGSITFNRTAPDGALLPPEINLFAARNLSTLWHESGHLFLKMMGSVADDLAAQDPATLTPQQAKLLSDYRDVLLPWLDAKSTADVGEPQQEQMARAFELYMMEGKAPSMSLRRVFARARAWLLSIYKDARGLSRDAGFGVSLNPEIRAVFDRLLASDAAIEAAQADTVTVPLFLSAEEAGWTPAVFEAYRTDLQQQADRDRERAQQRVMKEQAREQKAWWKTARAALREEIASAVHLRREYEALAVITKGTHADGTRFNPDVEPMPMKLSRQAIVQAYGKDALAGLPRGSTTTQNGLHPDALAEMTGYRAGEELLTDLRDLPSMNAVIDEETDAEMKRRHGDLVLDGSLADRAREAVMLEDGRADIIEAELRALAAKAREFMPALKAVAGEQRAAARAGRQQLARVPSRAVFQRVAQRHIAGTTIGAIRPLRHFQAARTSAAKAIDLVAAKDYQGALRAKTQHLLNLELYREAIAATEAIENARTLAARMFRPDGELAKSRNMDMVAAARAIMARYFFPARATDAFKALEKVREYDPDLYESLAGQVSDAVEGGGTLRDLTFEHFIGVRDAAAALWAMARRSEQMEIAGEKVARAEVVDRLGARLEAIGGAASAQPHTERQMFFLGARASLRRVEHWVEQMDGDDPAKPFRAAMWQPIADGAATFRVEKGKGVQAFLEIVKSVEKTLVPGKIAAPELGPDVVFESRSALLHALLHTGNASNLQKLLRGYNWGSVRDDGTLDDSRWRAFERRAWGDGTLTEADYDFAQATWALLDSYKPAAQRAHRDMYGHAFAEITAQPIETPWGTYPGGYVPAIADPLQVPDAAIRDEQHRLSEGDNAFLFPTTGRGFAKNRVEGYAKPLALDLRRIPAHIDKVLRFIHIEPRVKDVGRLLWDRRMRARLDGYDPTAASDMLVPWLQRAASQRVATPSKGWGGRAADAFFREVRTRTGLNIMTANVVNVLQQMTGLSLAATRVKPRYLARALAHYVAAPSSYAKAIVDESEWMSTRITPQVLEQQKRIEDLLLNPSKYQKVRDFGNAHGYVFQQMFQDVVDKITWGGAYQQATVGGADHATAVKMADAEVRMTQGSFAPEDLSRFEVGTPFMRAFTMFFSYFNMNANLLGTEFATLARDMGLRKGAGRGLYLYVFGLMVPAVVGELIRQSLGGFDADDDEDSIDEALWLFFGSQGRYVAGMVPIVGPAAMAFGNAWNDKPYDDRISTSPAISAIESAARAPVSVYQAIVDPDKSKKRAIRDSLSLIGLLTGLPVTPLGRPLGYAADVAAGEEEPTGADLAQGLITGRSQKDR